METPEKNELITTYLIQKLTNCRHLIFKLRQQREELVHSYKTCKKLHGRSSLNCKNIKIRIQAIDKDIEDERLTRRHLLWKLKKNSRKYKKIFKRITNVIRKVRV